MSKFTFLLPFAALFMSACIGVAPKTDANGNGPHSADSLIAYRIADRYFLRNDVKFPDDPIVTTQAQFDSLFGCAPVMGENGLPTKIDFQREFVIGISLPETNDETNIVPGEMTMNDDILKLNYAVNVGEQNRSFSIKPLMLLIVERKYLPEECVLKQN